MKDVIKMTHHLKVIADKHDLRAFYENMMMPLQKDWVYVIFLVARRKWTNCISRSEEMLNIRIFGHNDFDRFYRTLRRWEVPIDSFVDRNTKQAICQEAIGAYIDLTPKSVVKGLFKFFSDASLRLGEIVENPSQWDWFRRYDRKLLGYIHKSNAVKKPYMIIDVDSKDYAKLLDVVGAVGEDKIYWVTVTRGGYHVFIKREDLGKWWPRAKSELSEMPDVEVLDGTQTPIVGTYQGGVAVKFLRLGYDWYKEKERVAE